jgi:hypothetical protein
MEDGKFGIDAAHQHRSIFLGLVLKLACDQFGVVKLVLRIAILF